MKAFAFTSCLFISATLATTAAYAQKPVATVKPAVKTSAGAVRTVDIAGTDDMKFSITQITARRGEQLRVRLISKGTLPKIAMAHNVVVLKLGADPAKFANAGAPHRATDFVPPEMKDQVIAKTAFVGPGETAEVTFTVPLKAGVYPFVCTFPGHFQAGMKGTLIVK
jgi:azurin